MSRRFPKHTPHGYIANGASPTPDAFGASRMLAHHRHARPPHPATLRCHTPLQASKRAASAFCHPTRSGTVHWALWQRHGGRCSIVSGRPPLADLRALLKRRPCGRPCARPEPIQELLHGSDDGVQAAACRKGQADAPMCPLGDTPRGAGSRRPARARATTWRCPPRYLLVSMCSLHLSNKPDRPPALLSAHVRP